MSDLLVESGFTTPLQISIIFFLVFFIFNIFFWIKIFFEIQKFQKLEKVIDDLLVLKSSFYLNKLVEIRSLASKNKSYQPVFLNFYHQYQDLFSNNFLVLFDQFLESLNRTEDWSTFFLEKTEKINILEKLNQSKKKIEKFTKDLRLFSIWENFFLDKVSDFYYVLEKSWEEIEKNKIKLTADKTVVNQLLKKLQQKIAYLEYSIYQNSYDKTFLFYQKLETSISSFVSEIILWIKLQNLIFFVLPKKREDLQELVKQLQIPAEKKVITELNAIILASQTKIKELLIKFEVEKTQEVILELVVKLEENIDQLKYYKIFRANFQENLKIVTSAFEKIKKNFHDFKSFIKSIEKNNYIANLQLEKKLDFDKLINQTQKEIDWLFLKHYQLEKIYFFQPLLIKIKQVLENLQKLILTYHQMDHLIVKEKEEKEYFFLILNNLNTIINKKENFFLKSLYQKKLEKCIEMFINFEKAILLTSSKYLDYDSNFNDLKNRVLTLKMEMQEMILFKNLAENLFVFTNKYRFHNAYLYNYMLNCEVLFLKQNYKAIVDSLIELHSQQLPK